MPFLLLLLPCLQVGWEGFCSAGCFWGGWLCRKEGAAPQDLLALLGKDSFTGFTRRREEQIQTCRFEEVIPHLNQAPALQFSTVMGKVKLERSQGIKPRSPVPGVTGDLGKMILSWQSRQGPGGGWRQPSTAPAMRAWLAAWGEQGESRGLGAVLGRGCHHLPGHLTLPASSPPQLTKDNIYFFTEIHCFSNFCHHENIESFFSWKAVDLHM